MKTVDKNTTFGKEANRTIPYSSPGEMVDAVRMTDEYRKHPLKLLTHDDQTLKALVIEQEHLTTLAAAGASKYMILFAVCEEDVDKNPINQRFTTILVGIDDTDRIMNGPNLFRNKFMPCPSECYNYDELFPDI